MYDTTLHMTMLFDFYGELLTEKQREYFDLYHNEDLSLAEIAEKSGISRQGVLSIINRAEKTLIATEQKTKIIEKWHSTRKDLNEIEQIVKEIGKLDLENKKLAESADRLLSIITKLKQ